MIEIRRERVVSLDHEGWRLRLEGGDGKGLAQHVIDEKRLGGARGQQIGDGIFILVCGMGGDMPQIRGAVQTQGQAAFRRYEKGRQ